jgi:hypothetical protein
MYEGSPSLTIDHTWTPRYPGEGSGRDAAHALGAGRTHRCCRVTVGSGETQREVAAALGVARSTLLEWCHEQPPGDAPAGLVAFVRTPEGMSWLHRMVIAAHSVSGCGHPAGELISRAERAFGLGRGERRRATQAQCGVQWLASIAFFFATVTARVEVSLNDPQSRKRRPSSSSSPPCTSSASPHAARRPRPDNACKHRVAYCSTRCVNPIIRCQVWRPRRAHRSNRLPAPAPMCSNAAVPVWKDATANWRCIITAVIV